MYVQSMRLNGKAVNTNWISHFDLLKGGVLDFSMGTKPNKERGVGKDAYPYSFSRKQ
jgi:putative alpha-1,2-mannosidase